MKKDPFDSMDANDGYAARTVALPADSPTDVSVFVHAYAGGDMLPSFDGGEDGSATVEVWSTPEVGDKAVGAASRVETVMEAVCRYFNTGGSWDELAGVLTEAKSVIVGGLSFPGYYLHETAQNTDNVYEHVFVKDDGSGEAVLWVEDQFIDRTTLRRIEEGREEADGEDRPGDGDPERSLLGIEGP